MSSEIISKQLSKKKGESYLIPPLELIIKLPCV